MDALASAPINITLPIPYRTGRQVNVAKKWGLLALRGNRHGSCVKISSESGELVDSTVQYSLHPLILAILHLHR